MEFILGTSVVLIVIALSVLVYIVFEEYRENLSQKRRYKKKHEAEVLNAFDDLLKDDALLEIKSLLSARPYTDKLPPVDLLIQDVRKMHEAKEELHNTLNRYLAIMELIRVCYTKGLISEKALQEKFGQQFADIKENPSLSLHIHRCACNYQELNKYNNGLS